LNRPTENRKKEFFARKTACQGGTIKVGKRSQKNTNYTSKNVGQRGRGEDFGTAKKGSRSSTGKVLLTFGEKGEF